MLEVLKEAHLEVERENPCAFVILSKLKGSGPRKPGAMMLVKEEGSIVGTIGGGLIEKRLIDEAKKSMDDEKVRSISFELTEDNKELGLYCGGEVEFLIVPLLPQEKLIIFGAGHVSRALSHSAPRAGFKVTVVDDRTNIELGNFPPSVKLMRSDYKEFLDGLEISEKTYIVIATEAHEKDFSILERLLRNDTFPRFLGMLGSKTKFATFKKRAGEEIKEKLEQVRTPVGLDIGAETPDEIAISILAELIETKRMKKSQSSGKI